jgi:hypothetical protein
MKAIIMLELLSFIITGHKSVVIVLGDRNHGCESAENLQKMFDCGTKYSIINFAFAPPSGHGGYKLSITATVFFTISSVISRCKTIRI